MNETIRIAMIIQSYHPIIGGAERQLASLSPLLADQGVEVHILTRRYTGLTAFEVIRDVPVYRLPIPKPKPLASLTFTLTALPILQRLQPHVIHAHELLSPTTTAVAAKRLLNVPIVAKVLRGGTLGDLAKLQSKLFSTPRIAALCRHVDAFISVSHEIDSELEAIGISSARRRFVPNGVDTIRFTPIGPQAKQTLRATLDLPEGPITLFTGRLSAEKQLDRLLAIWPSVRAVHSDALLLLVGTGEEEQALRLAAGEGVRFIGNVDDVVPYLQAADLFVLPSATEGLSNALLEALAAGLPAIATAVGGAPDVIDHGNNGWLIPPDDLHLLRDAVLRLLGDASLSAQLCHHGRERVERDYALPVVAQRLRALYDELLHRDLGSSVPPTHSLTARTFSGTPMI